MHISPVKAFLYVLVSVLPYMHFNKSLKIFFPSHSLYVFIELLPLYSVSPNSDQDQFSPDNIHTSSTDKL